MIIAGTGHRPDKLVPGHPKAGYSRKVNDQLTALAATQLKELAPTLVISGMALGWDMALAEAAILIGTPFHAYVPFRGQEALWPKESQGRYFSLLQRAEKVVYVSPPPYAAWKMGFRNIRMVRALLGDDDRLLALWNGTDGGTGGCVAYAKVTIGEAKIINVWEEWKRLVADGDDL